jgi:hypothetical protein
MITPSFGLTATERVLPKLALDFTTASLDSRITFTRTTDATHPATYINSSGFVVAATDNQPRFDYDPTTLSCKGLLIEESRANSNKYSETFNAASWSTTNTTLTSSTQISPDGVSYAKTLTATADAGNISQAQSITASVTYCHSVWVMSATGSNVVGKVNAVTSSAGATAFTALPGVWTRVYNASSWASTATRFPSISINTNGDAIYIWGSQFEAGAFATSYIPTTTTALTRNADVATMTGTNFSDWFNASEGTFVVNGSTVNFTNSDVIVDATDGTTSNRIQMFVAGVTGAATTFMATGGATQAQFSAGTVTANTTFTFASGYKVNAIAASLNAATPATDTSATMPSGINTTTLGCRFNGVNQLNGYLRKVNYYPQRLTNAEIQAFSK